MKKLDIIIKSENVKKTVALTAALLFTCATVITPVAGVQAEELNGMVTKDGNQYWYENGILQGTEGRGKEIYDPKTDAWYWLDSIQNGAVAKAKDVYQESWAGDYADREDGTGKWVRYDENGHMIKGWDTNEDGKYYFEPITGAMAKGTVSIDDTSYRFDDVTGILLDKVFVNDNGCEYWYEGGIRQGLEDRGKEIYDPETDAWYWLDSIDNGKKATSKDVYQESSGGKWVRYDENGKMIKGWQWNEEKQGTYYFDPITGAMAKGEAEINGIKYVFDSVTGKLVVENQVAENGRLYALEAEQEAKYGKGNPFHVQALKEETDWYAKNNNLPEFWDGFYRSATFEQDGNTYLEEVYTEGSFNRKIPGVATSRDSRDAHSANFDPDKDIPTDWGFGDLARWIEYMTEGTVDDYEYIVFWYTYNHDTDITILHCEMFTINVKPQ